MRPLLLALLSAATLLAQTNFYLRPNDVVVFYGDSITDQRMYTTAVETFVVTRFPKLPVKFVHSGWGGDRVTGGLGGNVDLRLTRDVFPYQPTVMTCMLGMNDASYRPFDEKIFETYKKGYQKIVALTREKLPQVRLTLIQPSPFDQYTQAPASPQQEGYNDVLIRYSLYVRELARETPNASSADLNAGVVEMLKKAKELDAENASKIIPDRVHPAWGGHLVMAEQLLKAWNAPSVVTAVEIDAAGVKATKAENTSITNLAKKGSGLAWMQLDDALPMPMPATDEVTKLAIKASDFIERLNQEPLVVKGLAEGEYELKISGARVGAFSSGDLAKGINLATLDTPMMKQAEAVHALTMKRTTVHQTKWRTFQVPMASDNLPRLLPIMSELDALDEDLYARQRAAAQPAAMSYELMPVAKSSTLN